MAKFDRSIRLPVLMSDNLELALKDLRAAEASDLYDVNMNVWHYKPIKNSKCSVCFAGSVMAGQFELPNDEIAGPEDFGKWNESRLLALECIRHGGIRDGFEVMFPLEDVPENLPEDQYLHYADSPKKFHKTMEELVEKLRKIGL